MILLVVDFEVVLIQVAHWILQEVIDIGQLFPFIAAAHQVYLHPRSLPVLPKYVQRVVTRSPLDSQAHRTVWFWNLKVCLGLAPALLRPHSTLELFEGYCGTRRGRAIGSGECPGAFDAWDRSVLWYLARAARAKEIAIFLEINWLLFLNLKIRSAIDGIVTVLRCLRPCSNFIRRFELA